MQEGAEGGQSPRKGNLYTLTTKEDRLITGLTRAACGSLCHRSGIIIYHQSALLLWHKERPQMDLTNKQTERSVAACASFGCKYVNGATRNITLDCERKGQ